MVEQNKKKFIPFSPIPSLLLLVLVLLLIWALWRNVSLEQPGLLTILPEEPLLYIESRSPRVLIEGTLSTEAWIKFRKMGMGEKRIEELAEKLELALDRIDLSKKEIGLLTRKGMACALLRGERPGNNPALVLSLELGLAKKSIQKFFKRELVGTAENKGFGVTEVSGEPPLYRIKSTDGSIPFDAFVLPLDGRIVLIPSAGGRRIAEKLHSADPANPSWNEESRESFALVEGGEVRGFLNVREWIETHSTPDERLEILSSFIDPGSIKGLFFSSERLDGSYREKVFLSFKAGQESSLLKSYLSQREISPELAFKAPDILEFFLLSSISFIEELEKMENLEKLEEDLDIEGAVRILEFLLKAGNIDLKRDILAPLGESSLYGEGRKTAGIILVKIDEPDRFKETILKLGRIGKLFGKAEILERQDFTLVVIQSKEAPNRRRAIALKKNTCIIGRREKVFKIIDSMEKDTTIFSDKENRALWEILPDEATGYIYASAPYALRSIFPEGSETCHPCFELKALAADIGPYLDNSVGTITAEENSLVVDLVNPVPYIPFYILYKMVSAYDRLQHESSGRL